MIAFGTVVYPGALKYLNEFVNSLNNQTFGDFDLVIANDQAEYSLLSDCLRNLKVKYSIISSEERKTPADLRVDLIKYTKLSGYNLLVLGDIDDLFDNERISEIASSYEQNKSFSFFYNELILFDGTKALKSFPSVTNKIEDILQYNYLGLSNNSINLDVLTLDFIESLYGCTSFVFDWYLFSRILCDGGSGLFVEKAKTLYRIYDNNFAGISAETQLKKELDVKTKHYELMTRYNYKYKKLLDKLSKVDITEIKSVNLPSYWWNNIKL